MISIDGKFFVYFYYDNADNLLYIGKAIDVWERWMGHNERWKKDVCKIGVYECDDHAAMDILENYFIAKKPTFYNKAGLAHGYTSLEIPNLKEITIYSIEEFSAKFRPPKAQRRQLETLPPLDAQLKALGNTVLEINGFIDLYNEDLLQMNLDRVCFKYKSLYLISRFSAIPGRKIKKKDQHLSRRTNECIQTAQKVMNSPSLEVRTEKGVVHLCFEMEAATNEEAHRIFELVNFGRLYELYELGTYWRGERLNHVGNLYPQTNLLCRSGTLSHNKDTNTCLFDIDFIEEVYQGEQPIISDTTFSYDIEQLYSEIMANNCRMK